MNPVSRRIFLLVPVAVTMPVARGQEQADNQAFTLEEWGIIEKIRQEFGKNSDLIAALYRRALKSDPSLKGIVRLAIKISPAGNVLECTIKSSDLKSDLMNDLLPEIVFDMRFRDLGNKDVLFVTYPIEFFPE